MVNNTDKCNVGFLAKVARTLMLPKWYCEEKKIPNNKNLDEWKYMLRVNNSLIVIWVIDSDSIFLKSKKDILYQIWVCGCWANLSNLSSEAIQCMNLQWKSTPLGRNLKMICKAHCASAYPFGPLDVPLDPLWPPTRPPFFKAVHLESKFWIYGSKSSINSLAC